MAHTSEVADFQELLAFSEAADVTNPHYQPPCYSYGRALMALEPTELVDWCRRPGATPYDIGQASRVSLRRSVDAIERGDTQTMESYVIAGEIIGLLLVRSYLKDS